MATIQPQSPLQLFQSTQSMQQEVEVEVEVEAAAAEQEVQLLQWLDTQVCL
jgi:hypothetical protein